MTPTTVNIPQAVTMGVTTLAWYALPDAVRSRPARALLKAGLLVAGGAVWVQARTPDDRVQSGPDAFDDALAAVNEAPGKALAIGGTVLALGTALSVAGEKAIFAFGERRRARGVRFAHTLPALGLGVLGALTTLPLPDEGNASGA
ncbi:MAG: hypothetical protein Q4F65_03605 [Propionibacteriaceae bacterium]|nr:hypothetical protein [Propionibacteriaceae bacterium]